MILNRMRITFRREKVNTLLLYRLQILSQVSYLHLKCIFAFLIISDADKEVDVPNMAETSKIKKASTPSIEDDQDGEPSTSKKSDKIRGQDWNNYIDLESGGKYCWEFFNVITRGNICCKHLHDNCPLQM